MGSCSKSPTCLTRYQPAKFHAHPPPHPKEEAGPSGQTVGKHPPAWPGTTLPSPCSPSSLKEVAGPNWAMGPPLLLGLPAIHSNPSFQISARTSLPAEERARDVYSSSQVVPATCTYSDTTTSGGRQARAGAKRWIVDKAEGHSQTRELGPKILHSWQKADGVCTKQDLSSRGRQAALDPTKRMQKPQGDTGLLKAICFKTPSADNLQDPPADNLASDSSLLSSLVKERREL
uniref:Uncharacterized protein n=1 Tax=Sphaerodactylus townsendi TaxID=933632 RepID=A0ACB8F9N3_9SAUR